MNREINIRLNANRAKAIHTGYKFASGDKGIVFRIAVDELDTMGTTAKIVFKRSNGTSVEAEITEETEGEGVYSYTTLGNEFAVVGPVTADVKFYDENENRVSTCTFLFDVTADTLDGLGVGTAGYSDTLERMKKSMEQAEADMLAAKAELEKRAEEILQQMKETAESAEEDVETAEQKMADLSADLEALYQEYVDAFGSTGPFNPRGPYSETETYTVRDMVSHNDASWVCYRNCTGATPSKESDCWQYFAAGAEVILNDIISGEQQVGDAKTLDGHGAEDFFPNSGGVVSAETYIPMVLENKKGDIVYLQFVGKDWNVLGYIGFENTNVLRLLSGVGSYLGDILHTGNKPTGTYTGNGDGTTRYIETGGIGNVIIIRGHSSDGGYTSILTAGISFSIKDGGTIQTLNGSSCWFSNGTVTLNTVDKALNEAGVEYTYDVL